MTSLRSALSLAVAAGALAIAGVTAAAPAQAYASNSEEAAGPQKLVDKAASVITEMRADPKVAPLLAHAVGLYIIPEYGRAGFIIGGKGGAGVVVARHAHGWSSPAFFMTGGLNIGLQAGATGGSIVYVLLDHKALAAFRDTNKFSFDAHAGVAIVKWSDAMQASSVKGDAVLWTNMKGAYAGAVVGATDVRLDKDRTRDFYGRPVATTAVLAGQVNAPGAAALKRVLP